MYVGFGSIMPFEGSTPSGSGSSSRHRRRSSSAAIVPVRFARCVPAPAGSHLLYRMTRQGARMLDDWYDAAEEGYGKSVSVQEKAHAAPHAVDEGRKKPCSCEQRQQRKIRTETRMNLFPVEICASYHFFTCAPESLVLKPCLFSEEQRGNFRGASERSSNSFR